MGHRIRFTNLLELERSARTALETERDHLTARRSKRGDLAEIERLELARIEKLLASAKGNCLGPLFACVRFAFANDDDVGRVRFELDPKGVLEFDRDVDADVRSRLQTRVALMLGLVETDHVMLPPLVANGRTIEPDRTSPAWTKFSQGFYIALGEVKANFDLALKVLPILAKEGDEPGDDMAGIVSTLEFARVMRTLVDRGITAREPQLRRRVNECLDRVQDVGIDRPMHEQGFALPDLEVVDGLDEKAYLVDIAGTCVFAAMMDELKAFQVVDVCGEKFRRGELALEPGDAATMLYRYWREAPNRVQDIDRQSVFAQVLGLPVGPPDAPRNVDFQDLWTRLATSVSELVREDKVDRLLRARNPGAISQQMARKTARDLVTNIVLHSHGMAYYVALDLQQQLREMIQLLSSPAMLKTAGASNMWELIDYWAAYELGGPRSSAKYRTLATCGAIIGKWLSQNVHRLTNPSLPMIDLDEVQNPPPRRSGETATTHPNDYDFVNACELWLVDQAISPVQRDDLLVPRMSAPQATRPIQIPSIARELLDQAGLGLGMGVGMSADRGRARTGGYPAY